MAEKIVDGNVLEQYRRDYQLFAIYSEMSRSVPLDKDGLIPVYRRVVYCADKYSKADHLVKCASIIGSTMQHLHPHGDTSIRSALYSMINWFQTKYPLFIGRGNFGNTYRNVPANQRYTEAKISPFCEDCVLEELRAFNSVIDWRNNYDNSSLEPVFLPVKVPLLLLNGSMHMSVGDKVDVPSHNINEVIDQMIALIKNPKHQVLLVPDHCQACEIIDTDWAEISRRGFGHYKVRGVIEIKDYFGHTKKYNGRKVLAIRSCPNLTYLITIVEKIEKLIKDNKLIGIEDIEDMSEINNMNFVLILRPGTDPNFVKEALYQNTALQQTFRVNVKVVVEEATTIKSERTNYTKYLSEFIYFRKNIKLRYYYNLLQKINTRLHVIENYIWAVESGKIDDEVLALIRSQKTVDDNEMMEKLIKKCKITDIQAKFIMNMDVKKLSKGYYLKFKQERDELIPQAEMCKKYIVDEAALDQLLINELLDIKKKYGAPRVCRIISDSEASGIPQGIFKITISEQNYVKKIGIEDNITGTRQGDSIKYVVNGDNSKNILIFDINGKVYNLPISKIPFADKGNPGIDIRVISKYISAPIACVIYEPELEKFKKGYIITVTKQGFIKRMNTEDFFAVPPSGLIYSKIDQGDAIANIMLFKNDKSDIVVYNHNKALRIAISDIPILKRNARGNMSMGGTNHEVTGMNTITHNCTEILVITAKGYINKITTDVIPIGRTKAGKSCIKLTKGDYIVSVLGTNDKSTVRSILSNGQLSDFSPAQIPLSSSIAGGTKMNTGFLNAWNLQ